MALFSFKEIKCGYEGKEITYVYAISSIGFDQDEKVVKIPAEYEGKPITHVCYFQDKNLGYPKYHDWHHPSQGYDEYVPTEYFPSESSFLNIPSHVKKIIFPATVTNISRKFFEANDRIVYEIDGESEVYTVINGQLQHRKKD